TRKQTKEKQQLWACFGGAMSKTIRQIIPASGWYGVLFHKQPNGELRFDSSPIACWALVTYKDGSEGVEGMCGGDGLDFAEELDSFAYYTTAPYEEA
ncbi:MAG: hypothetical protein PHQ43_15665, partial [Dehalococcoidales bacterium]|nr:hypothetical protein [Dehalococcoidales bacterium]